MACLEPQTTVSSKEDSGEMAQSFRTSSYFVGEYFNWLKLNRVHPG